MGRVAAAAAGLAGLFGGPGAALACAFHTALPAETVADRVLASEHVVFARPDPDDPARWRPVAALTGPLADVVLPGAPDPGLRLQLAGQPRAAALFARVEAYGPWQRLAVASPALREVVAEVVARRDDWLYGGDAPRAAYFVGLLGHEDPAVRALALGELDRAPYPVLREVAPKAGAARLIAGLRAPDDGFAAIRALLLGLAGGDRAVAYLRGAVDAAAGGDWERTLGAKAVALMEAAGPAGVDHLAARFLAAPGTPPDQVELLVEAMAIQRATGRAALTQAIDTALARLAAARPGMAAGIARLFGSRGDLSQTELVRAAATARRPGSVPDILAVATYLEASKDMAPRPRGAGAAEME